MRPIKWKGIRSGLTICCQKISQTNLQSYSCIMKLKIINFGLFFKMRSRDDFPLDSSWFVCLWPTQKCRKTRSDIILVTNLLSESSASVEKILLIPEGNTEKPMPKMKATVPATIWTMPLMTAPFELRAMYGTPQPPQHIFLSF